jgi:hypothetical protein
MIVLVPGNRTSAMASRIMPRPSSSTVPLSRKRSMMSKALLRSDSLKSSQAKEDKSDLSSPGDDAAAYREPAFQEDTERHQASGWVQVSSTGGWIVLTCLDLYRAALDPRQHEPDQVRAGGTLAHSPLNPAQLIRSPRRRAPETAPSSNFIDGAATNAGRYNPRDSRGIVRACVV